MKKTLALFLALVMVFGLCACGGTTGSSTAVSDNFDAYAAKFGTVDGLYRDVTVASRMDIQKLDPTSGTGAPKDAFYWNIYECLFDLDTDGNLYPDLAKGYEPAEDGSYWDIFLYESIKDSNGNDITAEDAAASFKWLVDAGEALKYEDVKSWEAVDTYTFRIYWEHAPSSPNDYEFPLARTYVFDSQYAGSDFATQPVGTGNYVVADFVTGNHLTLWATPKYWALNTDEDLTGRLNLHDAHVQMINYEIISESATAEVALEEGTVDYCDYITQQASIEKFKTKYADKYVVDDSGIANTYFFLEPNMDSSSLLGNDENLRLAIYYGLSSDMIAALMGSSYVPMKTLGHRGFGDFNPEWENEENYCNKYDVELAKDYLAKSTYAGQDLNIICKTSEIEKNAAQSILSQLTALGITCHMTSVDNSIFTSETSDPANYDMILFEMGGPSLVSSLGLPLGNPNTNADGTDSWSLNFIRDKELVDLLDVAKADATHTEENVKAVIDYALGHSYIYPIAYSFTCYIYNKDITNLYTRENVVTPAACTFVGQTFEEERGVAVNVSAEEAGTVDPSLAGTYTYSEAANFGNKDNDFTLTLNADGTYRLDCDNSVGEKIWTEGTWTCIGEKVKLSEAKVQGDMDRLLNSGWADQDNPAPTFIVHPDGTMTPEGVEAAAPAEEAKPAEDAAPAEVPGIVKGLSGMGYECFSFMEDTPFGTFPWYVLKKDGDKTIVVTVNENLGGETVWHFENTTEDKGLLTLSGLEDGDKELPTMGDQWADKDNFVQKWQITGKDTIQPAGAAAPAEEAPAEEAPAAEAELPGIVNALTGMGYECFTFVEETPFGTFPWYVLKKDGDKTIVVTVNDNIGGETVWHFGTTTEDKGLLTLSDLEEGDKSLPTMGDQWSDKDNFIQKWQITGQGSVVPAGDK